MFMEYAKQLLSIIIILFRDTFYMILKSFMHPYIVEMQSCLYNLLTKSLDLFADPPTFGNLSKYFASIKLRTESA